MVRILFKQKTRHGQHNLAFRVKNVRKWVERNINLFSAPIGVVRRSFKIARQEYTSYCSYLNLCVVFINFIQNQRQTVLNK